MCKRTFPHWRLLRRWLCCILLLSINLAFAWSCEFLHYPTILELNQSLALFLEKLSLLVASSGITFDVSHAWKIQWSRCWDGQSSPPHDLPSNDRVILSLQAIWNIDLRPHLFPPHATIPWSLPSWRSQCWISRFQLGSLRASLSPYLGSYSFVWGSCQP